MKWSCFKSLRQTLVEAKMETVEKIFQKNRGENKTSASTFLLDEKVFKIGIDQCHVAHEEYWYISINEN